MREALWKNIGLSGAIACVLSLGLMGPGLVAAGQEQQDLCHSEGNGTWHIITVPEPAWQTHYDHGDAGVGEEVPGVNGYVFDEECNLVEVVVDECPCDFSEAAYLALAANPSRECYDDNTGVELTVGERQSNGDFFWLKLGNWCVVYDDGFAIEPYFIEGLTVDEEAACRQDIFAVVTSLNIPACE